MTRALSAFPSFSFERDVLPPEFKGLLEKERRVIAVDAPDAARLQGTVSELLSRLATEVGRLQQLRRDPTGTS